jgi:uncharacterized repeat protein (TIGR01451 family)
MSRFRLALLVPILAALGGAKPCLADRLAFVGLSNGETVVIDSGTNAIVGTIPADGDAIAMVPDGRRIFLSDQGAGTVNVVDVATKTVVHTFSGVNAPGLGVTLDGTRLYIANVNGNKVDVYDAETYAYRSTLPVQTSPVCIAMSPDGQLAYVSNFNSGSISRVNVATNTVIPGPVAVGGKPAGLVFHPSQPLAYVSNYANDAVQVIDTAASAVIVTIPVGDGPDSIAVSPAGDRVFVGNTLSGTISVIDTALNTVIATLTTGLPGGVSFLADGRAYALCGSGPAVCEVSVSNAITGTIPLPAVGYIYGNFLGPTVVAPDAPAGVSATAGNTDALVYFSPGASDGGLAPHGYTVQVSPGGAEVTGAASPIRVTGLTNGNAYTFAVRATNLVGPSAYSGQSPPVIPAASGNSVDLAIVQSAGPNPAGVGKDVVLTMIVTNNGTSAATGVNVLDQLTGSMDIAWTSPLCAGSATQVQCATPGGTLAAGASVMFRAVVRPTVAGSFGATATVIHADADPVASNDSAAVSVSVNVTPAGTPVQRYRLYSDVTKEHHFTTDLNEYNTLGSYAGTWVQEGPVGKVLDNPGSFGGVQAIPYYRLYDNATRWHHWTTDANEYYTLIGYANWSAEGVDGYILPSNPAGTTRLYRLRYPFIPGLHHWTIDQYEYDTLVNQYSWIGEGGTGFVVQ